MILRFLLISVFFEFAFTMTCYEPGQCINSKFIGAAPANAINECIMNCKNNSNCAWNTYNPNINFCNMFSDCMELDDIQCKGCLTNQKGCDIIECDIIGFCKVSFVLH